MSETEKSVSDLNPNERLALVALLKRIALANREVSEGEAVHLAEIAEAMGEEEYRRLMLEVDSQFLDESSFNEFLQTITDQASREVIYGLVMMEAGIDGIEAGEAELLTRLAGEWGISVVPEGMDFQP